MQKNITTITYGIWLIEPGGFLARLVRVMEEELKPKAWCWCLLLLTITTSTVMVVRPVTMSVVEHPRKRPISLPVVRVRVEVSPALLVLDHLLGGGRSCKFLRTLPALPPWLLTALVLGSSLLEECYEDLLHWLAHCSKKLDIWIESCLPWAISEPKDVALTFSFKAPTSILSCCSSPAVPEWGELNNCLSPTSIARSHQRYVRRFPWSKLFSSTVGLKGMVRFFGFGDCIQKRSNLGHFELLDPIQI